MNGPAVGDRLVLEAVNPQHCRRGRPGTVVRVREYEAVADSAGRVREPASVGVWVRFDGDSFAFFVYPAGQMAGGLS